MSKKIIVHMPASMDQHPIGDNVKLFIHRLCEALDELGLENELNMIPRHKELRRNTDYNHIVYHTHNKLDSWLHTQVAYLNEFFYLDTEGYSGWSAIRRQKFDPDTIDQETADRYFAEIRERYVTDFKTKYNFKGSIDNSEIPDGCIAIFLQNFEDQNRNLAYTDPKNMTEAAIRHRDGRPIVIKRHPQCINFEYEKLVKEAPSWGPDIITTEVNTHAIMPKADMVACINSGAGFEALLHEKHVVTLGRCDFHHGTSNHKDLDKAFQKRRHSPEYIRKYVYWYLATQVVDSAADNFTQRVKEQLTKAKWIA